MKKKLIIVIVIAMLALILGYMITLNVVKGL